MTATETFISTLTQTPALATTLQGNLQHLKDDNDEIVKVLGYSKTVADDLDTLDDTLSDVSDLLDIVEVIPEVGEAAEGLQTAVTAMSEEVKPARKAADRIEAKVKPVRDDLEKLDSTIGKAVQAAQNIASKSTSFLKTFTAVAQCIQSLPDGTYKSSAEKYLDSFSSDMEPVVQGMNEALQTANTVIEKFYASLQELKSTLEPLGSLASSIQDVLNVLTPVMGPLGELKSALTSIKIPIPIPYPHLVTLYSVFEEFSDFANLAMKPIQGLVNDLLSALNITLPSIPGLSELLDLKITIPGIPDFGGLLSAFVNPYNELKAAIGDFSLKCPPDDNDSEAPTWAGSGD